GYKTSDLVASAFGGQMYVTGRSTGNPLKLYGQQSYLIASLFGATGIFLALRKRRRSGQGEHIDISIQEAVTASLEHVMVRFFHEGIIAERQGNLHRNHFFHIFRCKDGFIQINLFEGWETLVEWMDSEGMSENLKDDRWRDDRYRRKHIDHIIKVIGRWTKTHSINELFHLGQLMRFSWAPVQTPQQIRECPQLRAREFFVNIEHREEGDIIKYPRFPSKFYPPITAPNKPAPRIGEDNIQIFCKELGLSKNKFCMLSAGGVI
ncbi:MAG: CoA transferase, partial [Desulfobacterales bacterium]